jgi:hypothetical protein
MSDAGGGKGSGAASSAAAPAPATTTAASVATPANRQVFERRRAGTACSLARVTTSAPVERETLPASSSLVCDKCSHKRLPVSTLSI